MKLGSGGGTRFWAMRKLGPYRGVHGGKRGV